jgi:hypothetical protein
MACYGDNYVYIYIYMYVFIYLLTLFSNTLSLSSSLNVRDQVSHPYRTKITRNTVRNIKGDKMKGPLPWCSCQSS